MQTPDSKSEKQPITPSEKPTFSEEMVNAAAIGGNAMAPVEPFGPAIGAALGIAEEGIAMLKDKKPHAKAPASKK